MVYQPNVLHLAPLESNQIGLRTRTSLHSYGLPLPIPSPTKFWLSYVDGDQLTMVRKAGLEPARRKHENLNLACLPIPSLTHNAYFTWRPKNKYL